MSRNYELIQQLEIVSPNHGRSSFEPDLAEPGELEVAAGAAPWANDEAVGIVQRILLPQSDKSPRVVVFAGINRGNGCSGLCASVASILAANDQGPVCIVDANFRAPALSEMLGVASRTGLAESLLREGPIRSFTKPVSPEGLWLLPCGGNLASGSNLLSSDRIKTRLEELRKEFSFVIVDTPPLSHSTDAVAVGQLSDGVILILEAASTRRESAQMAVATLRSANIPILGAVLNKRTFPIPDQIYKRL